MHTQGMLLASNNACSSSHRATTSHGCIQDARARQQIPQNAKRGTGRPLLGHRLMRPAPYIFSIRKSFLSGWFQTRKVTGAMAGDVLVNLPVAL